MTGRWAGVPVTASEGTATALLAATVEAPRLPSPAGEGEPSPGPSSAPDYEGFCVCDDGRTAPDCGISSHRNAAHGYRVADLAAPEQDDRAVRLALGWGAANLRLALVRDALKDCCEADRQRILGALGRES